MINTVSSVEYAKNNPEKRKEIKDRFNKNNPDKLKEYNKKYNQSPKGKAAGHNKRLKRKNLLKNFSLITPEIEQRIRKEVEDVMGGYNCIYCGKKMKRGGKDLDSDSLEHIIPITRTKHFQGIDLNHENNLTYCCYSCNSSKDNKTINL